MKLRRERVRWRYEAKVHADKGSPPTPSEILRVRLYLMASRYSLIASRLRCRHFIR
jgi:hypothetical protein